MLHVESHHKAVLLSLLAPYTSYDIRAYGSRVKNTHRTLSDLDLCIMKPIPFHLYDALVSACEESDLPFFVSIAEWPKLSVSFQHLIEDDLLSIDHWH